MTRPGGPAATAPAARGGVRRAGPHERRRHVLGAESLEPRLAMSADVADAIASARVFSAGTSITGRIGDGAWKSRDVDLVGFAVAAGGRLTADLDAKSLAGGSTLDGVLRVFDASGRVVAFNDDFAGSVDSFVSLTLPNAGTYYVGVSGFKNSAYNPRTRRPSTASATRSRRPATSARSWGAARSGSGSVGPIPPTCIASPSASGRSCGCSWCPRSPTPPTSCSSTGPVT